MRAGQPLPRSPLLIVVSAVLAVVAVIALVVVVSREHAEPAVPAPRTGLAWTRRRWPPPRCPRSRSRPRSVTTARWT